MGEPERPIPVRLSCAEAQSILLLMQSGSFVSRPATLSAGDKVRAALVATAFDPDVDIEVECTEDEARFIERGRVA